MATVPVGSLIGPTLGLSVKVSFSGIGGSIWGSLMKPSYRSVCGGFPFVKITRTSPTPQGVRLFLAINFGQPITG